MHSRYHQLLQIDCIALPSLIEAGASRCLWSKAEQSCSDMPPPSDMVFTVVVSLLTTIMTIPLVVILSATLDIYASKWPGKTADEDLVTNSMTEDDGDKHDPKTIESDTVAKQYFGEVIKKGIAKDRTTQSSLAKETVRFIYNGKFCCPEK